MDKEVLEDKSTKERIVIFSVVILLVVGIGLIYTGLKETADSENGLSGADKLKSEIKQTASEVKTDLDQISNILGGG